MKDLYRQWVDDSKNLHRDIASVKSEKADKTDVDEKVRQLQAENADLKSRLEQIEKKLNPK